MKFIKEDGTIEDGTPITDAQIRFRDTFVEYLHETMCRGAYHSKYSPGQCVEEGHKLASLLECFNDEDERLCKVLAGALPKPEPVEEIPAPEPVAAEKKPAEDDMPF